jgi:hypothetical protein
MITSVSEVVDHTAFSDEAYDHLDGLGIFSASEIRAQLTGVFDDVETPVHACTDACYAGGRPDGPQASHPFDEAARARLSRGYALASAVLSGQVDYRTLPVIR